MWRLKKIILLLCLFSAHLSFALDNQEATILLQEANTAFDAQDFDQAINKYESLIANDFVSTALYHNLSLSYYEGGNLAKAILNMERARRRAPMNRDVNHNLKLLKENVDGSYGTLPEFFLVAWYNAVVRLAPSYIWLGLHIIFLLACLGLLYLYLIKGQDFGLHRSYAIGVIVGLAVFALIFASFSYSREYLENRNDVAIVMSDGVALRAGAEDNSQEEGILNQGEIVYVTDKIGEYLKVKLEDLTEGWIRENEMERI